MGRKLREMSLEELLVEMHRMELTREDDVNGNEVGYGPEIEVHKRVLRVLQELKNFKSNTVKSSEDIRTDVERKLSKLLYNHGSEMKFRGQGSRFDAEKALEQAIHLDGKNGMAAYRLAFINYRVADYKKAIRYFNAALENTIHDEPIFCLSNREIYYARLYLMMCHLREADNLNDELDDPNIIKKYPDLPYVPYSIKEFVNNFNEELSDQAYMVVDNKKTRYVSYQEARGMFTSSSRQKDTLIIWLDGVNSKIAFNNKERLFYSEFKAKQLIYLLHSTHQNNPGNEDNMQKSFDELPESPDLTNTRIRSAIKNIRRLLLDLYPDPDLIITSRQPNLHGYYYNGKLPYQIICRSEEAMDFYL